jgi:hypothetical protein
MPVDPSTGKYQRCKELHMRELPTSDRVVLFDNLASINPLKTTSSPTPAYTIDVKIIYQ